jgi:hypothetical protein
MGLFSTDFRKIFKYQNFTKILPVEAEMFHADRRTEIHDEANIRFLAVLQTRPRLLHDIK